MAVWWIDADGRIRIVLDAVVVGNGGRGRLVSRITGRITFRQVVLKTYPLVTRAKEDLAGDGAGLRGEQKAAEELEDSGHWRLVDRSAPCDYLPGNPEYGETIKIQYFMFEVLRNL